MWLSLNLSLEVLLVMALTIGLYKIIVALPILDY
jgi:hypothetical protein